MPELAVVFPYAPFRYRHSHLIKAFSQVLIVLSGRWPNKRLPIRTIVLPSSIAICQSLLMPMESVSKWKLLV